MLEGFKGWPILFSRDPWAWHLVESFLCEICAASYAQIWSRLRALGCLLCRTRLHAVWNGSEIACKNALPSWLWWFDQRTTSMDSEPSSIWQLDVRRFYWTNCSSKPDAFRSEILRNQSSWAIKRRLILWLTNLRSDVWGKKTAWKSWGPNIHMDRVLHTTFDPPNGLFWPRRFFETFQNLRTQILQIRGVLCHVESFLHTPKSKRLKLCTQGSSR